MQMLLAHAVHHIDGHFPTITSLTFPYAKHCWLQGMDDLIFHLHLAI